MFKSRTSTTSLAKAARELERQIMTMEVVSGDEELAEGSSSTAASPPDVTLPDRLCFGPYGITPLRGLHYDSANDTATS
jgi:hypothetical protein